MKSPDWKLDAEGNVVVKIPDSVERVASLDDPAMQREYGARWVDDKLVIPPRSFVLLVDSVRHLGEDHLAEGDLADAGAVRWARNRIPFLLAAGWAKRSPWGGVEAV